MASIPYSLEQTMVKPNPDQLLAEGLAQLLAQAQASQQSAQRAAQQSFQQLQAAQASPPSLGLPLAALLPMIGANLASSTSGNPAYAEPAQKTIDQRRSDILQRRSESLELLANQHKAAADAAAKAGNILDELKYRTSYDKLLKQHQDLLDKAKEERTFANVTKRDEKQHQYDLELERIRQANSGTNKPLTPIQRLTFINTLQDNIRQDPDVAQFRTIRDGYNQGLRSSPNNAGDIILMRTIAKVSDPMSSVREEEFRTFQGAQGVMNRYGVQLTKGMWGRGTLSEAGRAALREELRRIYENKRVHYKRAADAFRMQAAEYQIDPNIVLPDLDAIEASPNKFGSRPSSDATATDKDLEYVKRVLGQ